MNRGLDVRVSVHR